MFQKAANGVSLALAGPSTTPLLADIEVPDTTIFAGTRSMAGRLRVLTSSMYAFFERTLSWYELLGLS